jgi:nucleotide-binding universal stress UspA family protein
VTAVRRILVGVSGSLGSLQALRVATEQARERDVPLVVVTAWLPPGGDMADRRAPSPYLREVWVKAAWQRLWTAFDEALGGVPAGLPIEPRVVRGEPGPVLVDSACSEGDLLVVGTGRRDLLGRTLHRSASRYCLTHSHCPILAVPPPELLNALGGTRHMRRPRLHRHVTVHHILP